MADILAIDVESDLREQVLSAIANNTPLNLIGGNSKSFYGRPAQGKPIAVGGHQGILNYEPTELVLTARCGTSLKEIEKVLSEHRQMLAFEPPHFASATLGGAVAAGISGSRRPFSGSARDSVLGVKILNGRGEVLKFGGEVMKNVAGFDISRLMAGALGTLGVLLEISIKVMPLPETERTLIYEMNENAALTQMNLLSRQNWPLSAACYDGENLKIRLSGAEKAIFDTARQLGGDVMPFKEGNNYWSDLREQKLAFFQDNTTLWRLSLPSAAAQPRLSGTWFIDWGGALRWLKTDETEESIFGKTTQLGGHACRFRSGQGGMFQPLAPALEKLHRKIKSAFDPQGIFNPGRLYPGW